MRPARVLQRERISSWQSAQVWAEILGRPDLAYYCEFGVPVNLCFPVASARAPNYATFREQSPRAENRLLESVNKGWIVGPISKELASFLGVVVSPLGCVPKDNGTDFRIIHDLSLFVNPFYNDPTLSFPSIDDVKRAISPGVWFWKGDLLDGFK